MFYQDFYYPGLENWYQVQTPGYHYQYHHHHRPRRKYGPYLVPSDPYLLHSDYYFQQHEAHRQSNFPVQHRRHTRQNLG